MITIRFLFSQLLFLAGGFLLVALGLFSFILAQVRGLNHEAMALKVSGSVLMVIGCLTFLEGFFGCCSMFFKKFSMLNNLRGVFMVVAVSAFLTGCYNTMVFQIIITNQEHLQWKLTYEMAQSSGWKLMQVIFNCCGINNYTDWLAVEKLNKKGCKKYIKAISSYLGVMAITIPFLLMANQLLVMNWIRICYEHYEED